ncbi:MAG TPA: endonuclease/exonuclease/phosphatase family protein [Pyrinomonadaceae bacterium]|nr:endonuclease/exonuclease/phosphatase family protein [Pyrinomonadaceae bacterium]
MLTLLENIRGGVHLKTFSLLLLLGLSAVASVASAQPQITVGAWNIQWLGAHNCRPSSVNYAQRPSDVAKFIMASGVDILGLEEITDDDGQPDTYTNQTLTSALALIKAQTGDTWQHMLFRKDHGEEGCQARHLQLTGVAWNTTKAKRVDFKRIPIDTSSIPPGLPVWKRPPVVVKFSLGEGKTDIAFIVVHMKSNKGDNTPTAREWEARTMMDQLDFIKGLDQDIIILGDTNVLGAQEAAIKKYVDSGFIDLNSTDMSTSTRDEPFDRILLRSGQPEFEGSPQRVFGDGYLNLSKSKFLRKFSDHYMVTTKIKVEADDDQ